MVKDKQDCPNLAKHTKCPQDYLNWHEWAEKKGRRHKQIKCLECGLWAIWVRRGPDEPDFGNERGQ